MSSARKNHLQSSG